MPLNHDITKTHRSTGEIWVGLSIPIVGESITLDAAGIPDAIENPNALNLGLTAEGATMTVTRETEDEFFDNYKQSLQTEVLQTGGKIEATIAQVRDIDILEYLASGVGTKDVGDAGKDKIRLGETVLAYGSVAVISPQRFDDTKFLVTHLYNAINLGEIVLQMSRATRAGFGVSIQGYSIAGRDKSDAFGAIWWDQ